jgi:GNAT superfamily N-acetyltransferase
METKIRIMRKQDLQQLAEIYTEVYRQFDVGEHWTPQTARSLLSYWLNKQPDLAFVAECDRQVVGGIVAGIKPWWDGNHLADGEMFVHPNYQRHGIGRKLSIALYERALKKYQVTSFDAYTFKKTKFPLSWYKSQGFIVNPDWAMISGDVKSVLSKIKRK